MCMCKLGKKKKKHPYFDASNNYFTVLGYTAVWSLKKYFGKEEKMMASWRCHAEVEEIFVSAGIFTMFTSGTGTGDSPIFTA